ncbi:MAG: AmmeMemoRadiSam system protein B [Anaeromyxobacteraceae bacterium]
MLREPAVAGRFYPGNPSRLAAELDGFLQPAAEPGSAKGLVAPHAGYMYSGAVAGDVYRRVEIPPRVVILGPNHTGLGAPASLWPGGSWRTPLGDVPIDAALTEALARAPGVELDDEAHLHEHSLEVQVPFLQRRQPALSLAAICLGPLSWKACEALGKALGAAATAAGALIVASSDMSHYIPAAEAREKDQLAIDRILALDPAGLYEVVRREQLSMCGFIPATVMLVAAREMGATRGELVRYGHSGEVTGDDTQVVGYAAIRVW